ncbi:NADPH:quinone reductase [Companilactobacillus mishanensis]|uniref:NADPH:quinone reductase n=1 Tax=Companilactobacillus mishanensis TaxID=2486008 RepID=A0A5P0ZGP6_9LACO|nr:NADPH:quinone reductase [Companilactobacillus mishanensis]MQS52204.1 NADPH:quinone reductase [Companilactobacillus mishanensis]
MKAAYILKTGNADQIQIGELPMPKINDNEILVKVIAVSVNNVDTFVRSGGFKTEMEFPFVVGRDAVGMIESLGKQVKDFKKGDLVWTNSMGYDGRQGVTSEYISVPESRAYPVPFDVDPKRVVASVHSAATAVILLNDVLHIRSGQSILVEGAAGHVGDKILEYAAQKGLEVSTTSNPRDFDCLKKLGSEKCFDYHDENLTDKILDDKSLGFDYVVDTSGQVQLQDNIDMIGLHGSVGLITTPKSGGSSFNVGKFYTSSKSIKGFVISHASSEQLKEASKILNESFEKGKLLEKSFESLSFDKIAQIHQKLEHGQVKTKVVLTFQ